MVIVQARFPELTELARQLIEGIREPAVLQQLLIEISVATSSQVAEQAVIDLHRGKSKKNH